MATRRSILAIRSIRQFPAVRRSDTPKHASWLLSMHPKRQLASFVHLQLLNACWHIKVRWADWGSDESRKETNVLEICFQNCSSWLIKDCCSIFCLKKKKNTHESPQSNWQD